jgi:amino acid adenylation domain-containing protein
MYAEHCAHVLFEHQAERTPDALAAVYDGQALTYGELNRRVNQLAHHLRRNGVGPEVPVGVLMEPSLEIIIAVMGILKAGGAYVALDPHHPEFRLHEMIQAARPACIVTIASLQGRAAGVDVKFVCMDQGAAQIAAESQANPQSGVTLDHMAFVRFTSGSTGTPKGVVNIHRSVTSRLASTPLPDILANDVCALNTRFGLGSRLFFPLALGASLVVLNEAEVKDARRLVESLERNRVTSILLVPSHLRQVLDLDPNLTNRLRGLRAVTAAGEPVTEGLIARFRDALPQAHLINIYGSNEIGGTAALRTMTEGPIVPRSIGWPVVHTRIYLLDAGMNPVPAGVIGEIHVASGHLARGYLHRPDLTAMRFIPDPFSGLPGGRMYRTGDLGRLLPNGEIEFLGRADRQVKVRGSRVELEEVEARLLDHPLIHQAAVTAHVVDSDHRLVAYVVGKAGVRPRVSQLRSYARQYMPDFMVPAAFVVLDRMPLTRNGKVDLQALPALDRSRPEMDNDYEEPRNPVEVAIAEIWSSLLGVERVGVHDNFLELGGDSLLAARAVSRIRERLGVEVPLDVMLDATIGGISAIAAEMGIGGHLSRGADNS